MDRSRNKRSFKDQYLIFYNSISALLWFAVLGRVVLLVPIVGYEHVYDAVGEFTKWVQTMAILEVFHIMFGLLRSSLPTTIVQVSSRLFLVWGIAGNFEPPRYSLAYTTTLLAWSVTEVFRYTYYITNIIGRTPPFLAWFRYNTFFILYPLGAGSEAWCVYQSLNDAKAWDANCYRALVVILCIYPPALYKQYTHMISQRRKNMRGKKRQN